MHSVSIKCWKRTSSVTLAGLLVSLRSAVCNSFIKVAVTRLGRILQSVFTPIFQNHRGINSTIHRADGLAAQSRAVAAVINVPRLATVSSSTCMHVVVVKLLLSPFCYFDLCRGFTRNSSLMLHFSLQRYRRCRRKHAPILGTYRFVDGEIVNETLD